jgi:hypothetical protein
LSVYKKYKMCQQPKTMVVNKFHKTLKGPGVLFRYSARGLQAGVGIALWVQKPRINKIGFLRDHVTPIIPAKKNIGSLIGKYQGASPPGPPDSCGGQAGGEAV